jgi:hypothetical protein
MPGFGRTPVATRPAGAPAPVQQAALAAFKRVGQVSGPNAGGNYFGDGRYFAVLNKITAGNSKANKGEYAAVEFTIVEVQTAFEADVNRKAKASNKPGERVSVTYMFTKHGDVAVSNFRGLIGACMDMDPDATDAANPRYCTPEQWEQACYGAIANEGTALAMIVLDVTAITVPTKTPGGVFTKTVFMPVDQETETRILGILGIKPPTTA